MAKKEPSREERLTLLLRGCGRRLYHSSCAGRTQARVLCLLAAGSMTQRELQERLQIQAGSMSELVSKLELKGFLQRSRDPRDRRRMMLALTGAGRRAAQAADARPDISVDFDGLTAEEQARLAGLLEKLIEHWREEGLPESELTLCGGPGGQ